LDDQNFGFGEERGKNVDGLGKDFANITNFDTISFFQLNQNLNPQ